MLSSPGGSPRGSPRGSPHRFPADLPSGRLFLCCSLLLRCLFLLSGKLLLLSSKSLLLSGKLLLQLADLCCTLLFHRRQFLPQCSLLLAGFLSDLRNSRSLLTRCLLLLGHSLRRFTFCLSSHNNLQNCQKTFGYKERTKDSRILKMCRSSREDSIWSFSPPAGSINEGEFNRAKA